jgi:hypothetical protein
MGKTIWHLSRDYSKIIKKPNNFWLCTIAFCKELIIKIRPDLETYIFITIKNSHILSYKWVISMFRKILFLSPLFLKLLCVLL